MSEYAYSDAERAAIYRAIGERRDMRHFAGGEVAPELLGRLLAAAHQAPSVGLMQPWRFLRITELPKWVHEHDEVSDAEWRAKDVGSKANCPACHVDANKGYFEDD